MRTGTLALSILLGSFAAAGAAVAAEGPTGPREVVHVERILLDVRAVDGRGRPIIDLEPLDFQVSIGGTGVAVEAADWTTGAAPALPPGAREKLPAGTPIAPAGRLIVLLFQRDLIPSRITGLMRVRDSMIRFLDELRPEDRVAILTHDKRLELYTDFTADRGRLQKILEDSIVARRPPGDPAGDGEPALADAWDGEAAARATNAEDGLHVLADALRRTPGSKSLLFLGWGMNRWDGATDVLGEALGLMIDGHVTLFSLDVTDADGHSLEAPMIQAAGETGGFYARTHVLSESVLRRVAHAVHGHYELTLVKPDGLTPGRHSITVELRRRKGRVYHRAAHDER